MQDQEPYRLTFCLSSILHDEALSTGYSVVKTGDTGSRGGLGGRGGGSSHQTGGVSGAGTGRPGARHVFLTHFILDLIYKSTIFADINSIHDVPFRMKLCHSNVTSKFFLVHDQISLYKDNFKNSFSKWIIHILHRFVRTRGLLWQHMTISATNMHSSSYNVNVQGTLCRHTKKLL